jgi:hypothetical protein
LLLSFVDTKKAMRLVATLHCAVSRMHILKPNAILTAEDKGKVWTTTDLYRILKETIPYLHASAIQS